MRKVELRMNEEKKYKVIKKLVETNGNKKRAAIELGVTVRQINRMIAGSMLLVKNFLYTVIVLDSLYILYLLSLNKKLWICLSLNILIAVIDFLPSFFKFTKTLMFLKVLLENC